MWLRHLWLEDFRNYRSVEVVLEPGLTVLTGANGVGKSNLLEGIGYLATLSSFRGAPPEALVRHGCERATVRGEGERAGRHLLVEAEIATSGRGRTVLNRQPVRRTSDLSEALRVSVFAPDDLDLVKGGPSSRRRYLDDLLVALHARHDLVRRDLERILRQRNALLRQVAGRKLSPEDSYTLDVWDAKLAATGEAMAAARVEVVSMLDPEIAKAYAELATGLQLVDLDGPVRSETQSEPTLDVETRYESAWMEKGLAACLEAARAEELRRGASLVGPHRDDLVMTIGGMPSRTHASQGEQRCLSLSMRLAAHRLVTRSAGEPPILLLDDVFSELDPGRSRSLLEHLRMDGPGEQTLVTTSAGVPGGGQADRVLRVAGGQLSEAC